MLIRSINLNALLLCAFEQHKAAAVRRCVFTGGFWYVWI